MKTLLIAFAAFIACASAAHAQIGAAARPTAQVCRITAAVSLRGSNMNLPVCDGIGVTEHYLAFAIDPTGGQLSTTPLIGRANGKQVCYYLSNKTNTPFFIPARTEIELAQFLIHMPAGVNAVPCTSTDGGGVALDAVALCGGKMVNTAAPLTAASYTQGFNGLGVKPAYNALGQVTVQRYNIINAQGQLLRTLTAVANTKTMGWDISYDQTCAQAEARLAGQTAAAMPAAFNPATSGTQRVFITDGALARGIR